MKFQCQRSGRCCSHPKILITLTCQDLPQIVAAQGGVQGLLEAVAFAKIDQDGQFSKKSDLQEQLVISPINTSDGSVIPVLKKRQGGFECIFYDSTTHTCQIYDKRPLTCQSFPIRLATFSGRRILTWNTLGATFCPGIGKGPPLSAKVLKAIATKTQSAVDTTNEVIQHINLEAEVKKNPCLPKKFLLRFYISRKRRTVLGKTSRFSAL